MGKPLLAYIDWAIAENDKPCSAYYQSLDTTKIAANGFSCGGLMAEGTAGDPRITTWGINSSGMLSANQAFYRTVHTPVLIVLGGPSDIAYENGERDYTNIAALGIPIMLFSKDIGHGGDLFSQPRRGLHQDRSGLAELVAEGRRDATGKGLLVGAGCTYCTQQRLGSEVDEHPVVISWADVGGVSTSSLGRAVQTPKPVRGAVLRGPASGLRPEARPAGMGAALAFSFINKILRDRAVPVSAAPRCMRLS